MYLVHLFMYLFIDVFIYLLIQLLLNVFTDLLNNLYTPYAVPINISSPYITPALPLRSLIKSPSFGPLKLPLEMPRAVIHPRLQLNHQSRN